MSDDLGDIHPVVCEEIPVTPTGNTGVTFQNLQAHHCRYILASSRYCGERKRAGSSFCPDHHRICWVPLDRNKRKRR